MFMPVYKYTLYIVSIYMGVHVHAHVQCHVSRTFEMLAFSCTRVHIHVYIIKKMPDCTCIVLCHALEVIECLLAEMQLFEGSCPT